MTIEEIELQVDAFYSVVYEYGYDCCWLKGKASTENIRLARDNLLEAIIEYGRECGMEGFKQGMIAGVGHTIIEERER